MAVRKEVANLSALRIIIVEAAGPVAEVNRAERETHGEMANCVIGPFIIQSLDQRRVDEVELSLSRNIISKSRIGVHYLDRPNVSKVCFVSQCINQLSSPFHSVAKQLPDQSEAVSVFVVVRLSEVGESANVVRDEALLGRIIIMRGLINHHTSLYHRHYSLVTLPVPSYFLVLSTAVPQPGQNFHEPFKNCLHFRASPFSPKSTPATPAKVPEH